MIKIFSKVSCQTKLDVWSDKSRPLCTAGHQLRWKIFWKSCYFCPFQTLQEVQFDIWKFGNSRVKRNQWCYWMLEAMSLQKVHPWRAKSFKFQVEALHLLHMGGVEHDQGRDGGVDIASVNLGGRVRWITWVFLWDFHSFPFGIFVTSVY